MTQMPTPKQECEALMNDDLVLPFAKQCLEKWGEFHPFGAALKSDGSVIGFGVDNAQASSPEKVQFLRDAFVERAAQGKVKATVLVYDTRLTDPDTGEKRDAITIELDHRENYSVVVYFRYRFEHGVPILEGPTASQGAEQIFG